MTVKPVCFLHRISIIVYSITKFFSILRFSVSARIKQLEVHNTLCRFRLSPFFVKDFLAVYKIQLPFMLGNTILEYSDHLTFALKKQPALKPIAFLNLN